MRSGVLIAAMLATSPAYAQQVTQTPDTNDWFVRIGYAPARVIAINDFQSGDDTATSVTIEVGRQTDGSAAWHRVYNYPAYGVGFYTGAFDHDRELGRPVAAYGFFSWPFPITERVQVTSDVGLGVSWHWNEFDPSTNPSNTALGSDAAYHIDVGAFARYAATTRASVYAGVALTHWSNGGTKQPNLGLFVIGPKVGVRYNLAPQPLRTRAAANEIPPFHPAWEFVVGAGGYRKNTTATTNANIPAFERRRGFGAFNVTTGLQRHFYRFGKVATGADLTYDGATGARVDVIAGRQIDSRASTGERFALGLYGGYEHVIARFSVLVQVGRMVGRGFEDPEIPPLYQRYGARFHLTDRLWTTFAVRTLKGRRANFVEFGGGYRIRLRAR